MRQRKNKDIKIGIIGNGSVGQTFSVMLSSAGYDVEVAGRRQRGIKIGDAFVYEIMGDFGDKSHLVSVVSDAREFKTKKDIIIIATRLFDTPKAAKYAYQMLEPNGAIVTIQNWFCLDKVMKNIPSANSVCMALDFTSILNDDVVRVIDTGGIHLGVYDTGAYDKLMLVKEVLSSVCEVKTTNDVFGYVLSRNVLNGAIASLGAISGLRLGEFLSDKNARKIFVRAIMEAVDLISRMKIKILPYNNHLNYYLFCKKTLGGLLYRKEMLKLLKKNNYYIKSSALEEIESGKKCELFTVMTSLVVYGKKMKLKLKCIYALYEIIEDIIKGKRAITPEVFKDKLFTKKKTK